MASGFATRVASDARASAGRLVRPTNAGWSWLWSVLVAAAMLWGLTAVAAHGGSLSAEHHKVHQPHALLTSLGAEFAVAVHHAHLVDGSSHSPEQLASAVLPRSATASAALAALGVVVAVLAVIGALGGYAVSAGRGPPSGLALVVTGRDRLTRLCLARR